MRNNRNKANYLDFIPMIKSNVNLTVNEDGEYSLLVENRGFMNKLAQKLFRKPKISRIKIDSFGEFIWLRINGINTVYDIANMVKEEFGEKAEPLYERICLYFKMLDSNELVSMEVKK